MRKNKAVRWSVDHWSKETGVHPRTVKQSLSEHRIVPGDDGNYSTLDMVTALCSSPKEQQARDAKLQSQIDESDMVRNEKDVQEGRLAYVKAMKEWAADIFTRLVQMVKQSRLSQSEKIKWIAELNATEFEPTKILPFK